MTFHIVYPERRIVSAKTIESWFRDAIANGEIDDEFAGCLTVQIMARALDNAGIITLAKKQ